MALRIATLQTGSRPEPYTPREWRRLVARTLADGERAVVGCDAEALAGLFQEIGAWKDADRALQGRARLTEVVFGSSSRLPGDSWTGLYATAAEALVDALETEPREPLLLNYAGVLLYELTELDGAEALFEAAGRLDPTLPYVGQNLDALRARKRLGTPVELQAPSAGRAHALGERARHVAAAAQPVQGLTVSLCVVAGDDVELLPGCLEAARGAVDEIVVVDTGSDGRTVRVAESFGATIVDFPGNGSLAEARNAGLEASSGDWLLSLDPDEHLVAADGPGLRELLGRNWRDAFQLAFTDAAGGNAGVVEPLPRLVRRREDRRFGEGSAHRWPNLPYYLPERFETAPVRVVRCGYLEEPAADLEMPQRELAMLERELADGPGPFASYVLGVERARLGSAEQAEPHLQRAWDELGGGLAASGYGAALAGRLAACKRALHDDEGARAVLEHALVAFPDHTDYVLQLALIARDRGDLEQAEQLVLRCLELGDAPASYRAAVGSGTFTALGLLADVCAARGDEANAEMVWRRSLAEYPAHLAPVSHLAPLLAERGATLGEIAAQLPDSSTARLLAASALLDAGRAEEAERLSRLVREQEPSNAAARIGLAEALLAQQRYTEAAAEAGDVRAGSPRAARAATVRMLAAAAATDADSLAEACAYADARCDPGTVAYYRAWHALLRGEEPAGVPASGAAAAVTALETLLRTQQLETFERAHAAFAHVALPERERQELLARMYLRHGFLASAADEWIGAAQAAPRDTRAFVGLAQVAFARGLTDDARTFAAAAVESAPDDRDARRLHDALLRAA